MKGSFTKRGAQTQQQTTLSEAEAKCPIGVPYHSH